MPMPLIVEHSGNGKSKMPFFALMLKIITHINFKIASIVLVVALIWLGAFSWIKLHDAKITAKAMAACPPQTVITGNGNRVDQRVFKMKCFPVPKIGRIGLGFCWE